MFKSFPHFPRGPGGLGLLAARLAGAALGLFCVTVLAPPSSLCLGVPAAAAALVVGFLTRPAALALVLMIVAVAAGTGGVAGWLLAIGAAQLLTPVLAGGGAYSLDARLFGQRVIRVERDHTSV